MNVRAWFKRVYDGAPIPDATESLEGSQNGSQGLPVPFSHEELDELFMDILDLTQGWTRPMTDRERLDCIEVIVWPHLKELREIYFEAYDKGQVT